MRKDSRRVIIANLMWFLGALILAFIVWFGATLQEDPIGQVTYRAIDVQIEHDDDLVITNDPRSTVRVFVRAQQSVLNLLSIDDVTVQADLMGREPGLYTIPLTVEIARPATWDTQPRQITIELEQISAQQKPVQIDIVNPPPLDYANDPPTHDVAQVEVRGATNTVGAVVAVRGEIDLEDRRDDLTTDVTLVPVDANGRRVGDVTISPRTTAVQVNIFRREGVRQVAVSPDIRVETLPVDYTITDFSVSPQTVFISGSESALSQVGDLIRTQAVDLTGRSGRFIERVDLQLPPGVVVLSEQSQIRVTVELTAQTTTRQFADIPLETVGLPPNYTIESISSTTITVLLSGSVSEIENLEASDVQALLDLTGVTPGSNEITPRIDVPNGQNAITRTPNPASVIVVIAAEPEETLEPERTPETRATEDATSDE